MSHILNRRSIRVKILRAVFASLFFITAVLGCLTFHFSKNRLVFMLGESSKGIASTVANFINPQDLMLILNNKEGMIKRRQAVMGPVFAPVYENAQTPGADNNESLRAAVEKYSYYTKLLLDIQKVNNISSPISLYIKRNNRLVQILKGEMTVQIGSLYAITPVIEKTFLTGLPQTTGIYTDKDGSWISAYAPIPEADIRAIVEINNNINLYIRKLRSELNAILLVCAVGFLAAVALSYNLVKNMVSNIKKLNAIAGDLEMERYDLRVDIRSNDEIGHLAKTFEKMRLSIKKKIDELRVSLVKEKKAHLESIIALSNAIGLRDPYTREHLKRVDKYALLIAKALKLPRDETKRLTYGCYLHDIGKIYIEDKIFRKVLLSQVELENVRSHAAKGAEIIEGIPFFENVKDIILCHQERYDGTGYPKRLKGAEIPLLARIVAVADAFDAMTTDRPYKPKVSFREAMDVIEKNAGTQFDPQVAGAFLKYRNSIEKIAKKHF
jgi:putative nucleotidyltransferase with HDIG domain